MTHRITARVGEVSYNGFRFPAPLNAEVQSKAVYDSSGRTIKWVEITLRVSCTITAEDQLDKVNKPGTAGNQVDPNFTNLRQRLQQAGRGLIFRDQGFGDLTVNESVGGVLDIDFGPKPSVVAWKSIGSNRTVFLVWECTTRIPECPAGTNAVAATFNNMAQFNYSVNWAISNQGITTRTIIGLLEVTMTRSLGPAKEVRQTIPITADSFRRRINFPVPTGFKRSQVWSLSEDKKIISFTITDSEIPSDNPYQPGIVNRNITHRISSNMAGGFKQWMNTISGSIEVAPGYAKSFAWLAFLQILDQRLGFRNQGTFTDGKNRAKKSSILIFPSIEIIDNLDGRDISFSISYIILSDLPTIFKATGLFRPIRVPGQSWELWKTSLGLAYDSRGTAQMGHSSSDDIIIDPCHQAASFGNTKEKKLESPSIEGGMFDCPLPDKDKSYLVYEVSFELVEIPSIVKHVKLKNVPDVKPSDNLSPKQIALKAGLITVAGSVLPTVASTAVNIAVSSFGTSAPSTYQIRGPTQYELIFRGHAVRIGYPISNPKLESIGDKPAFKNSTKSWFKHREMKALGPKCIMFSASWKQTYTLTEPPSDDVMNKLCTHNLPRNFNQ